jgi:hypothetical protein
MAHLRAICCRGNKMIPLGSEVTLQKNTQTCHVMSWLRAENTICLFQSWRFLAVITYIVVRKMIVLRNRSLSRVLLMSQMRFSSFPQVIGAKLMILLERRLVVEIWLGKDRDLSDSDVG